MRKPSYSAVTSTLALVVAMSGAGYAFSLPDNSVGTRHLKDGAVTTPKIADEAVTTAKIGDEAVTTAKLHKGAVTGSKLAAGSVLKKHLGFSSMPVARVQQVYSGNKTVAAGDTKQAYAHCPAGQVVTGGGWFSDSYEIRISSSRPEDINTWVVDLWNQSSGQITFGAWAVCASGDQDTINDPPVLVPGDTTQYYLLSGPAVTIDPDMQVFDPDSANLQGAQVTISNNFHSGDDLVFINTASITGTYNTGTGVLTLTGTATVSEYEQALRSIKFQTTNNDVPSTRSIQFTVSDATRTSNVATKTVTVDCISC